jgi:hypothetical protein
MNKAQLAIYILFFIAIMAMLMIIVIVFYVYFRELEKYKVPGNFNTKEHILLVDQKIVQKDIDDVYDYIQRSADDIDPVEMPPVPITYTASIYNPPDEKKGVALCFSGGGVIAMTHCIGFLCGFHSSGYLSEPTLISATSGSSWAIVPSSLVSVKHPQNNLSLEKLYGPYVPPDQETLTSFRIPFPENSLAYMSTNSGNLARFMRITIENFKNKDIPREMAMSDAIAQMVLKHLNMYCHTSIVQPDNEQLQKVLKENQQLNDIVENMFILRENHPPFSVSVTGHFPLAGGLPENSFPLEYTESRAGFLCSNILMRYQSHRLKIGNQVSNYAFNSTIERARRDYITCSQTSLYNITGINQMVSVGSSFTNKNHDVEYVRQLCTTDISANEEIYISNGGAWDNSAMTSALARQIPHLVVFLLDGALDVENNHYPLSLCQPFGMKSDGTPDLNRISFLSPEEFKTTAEAIERSQHNKYAMDHQRQWHPAVYTQSYQCNDIDIAGIRSYEPLITWVIPRKTYQYQTKLRQDVNDLIESLPNYPTFINSNDMTAFYELTPSQAHAVISLNSWIAKEILTPLLIK